MSLYNMINGINPATFIFLPMLGKHPDEYPRFRDCFINDGMIEVYTRVGGNNRDSGLGEEELYKHPNFVKTYDDDFDNTYGTYVFSVPDEWKEDFEKLLKGEKPSQKYVEQMCKIIQNWNQSLKNYSKINAIMKKFYFTFGVGLDNPHRNCYHVIEAEDAESARDKMFETFGQDWAFQYTEEGWLVSKEKYDLMKNWRTVGEWHEGYTQAELFNLEEI